MAILMPPTTGVLTKLVSDLKVVVLEELALSSLLETEDSFDEMDVS